MLTTGTLVLGTIVLIHMIGSVLLARACGRLLRRHRWLLFIWGAATITIYPAAAMSIQDGMADQDGESSFFWFCVLFFPLSLVDDGLKEFQCTVHVEKRHYIGSVCTGSGSRVVGSYLFLSFDGLLDDS